MACSGRSGIPHSGIPDREKKQGIREEGSEGIPSE